jgi:integrase
MHDRPAAHIKRTDVVAILDDVAAKVTPIQANKVQSLISAVFSWAVNEGRLESTPAFRVPKRTADKTRERVLTDDEIRALWAATSTGTGIDKILRFALVTGQRRGEISGLPWSELNLDELVWTIPSERAKNKIIHRVPLTPQAIEIIGERPTKATFVFPGRADSSTGFISPDAVSRHMWKLAIGEPQITTHDIRRTVGTRLAALGTPKDIRARVLNHVSGARSSVTDAVYNMHDGADEKRRALELWADRLAEIIEGSPASGLKW